MTQHHEGATKVWAAIDADKRRDRTLRRITVTAWTITLGLVLVLGLVVGLSVADTVRLAAVGAAPWLSVAGAALPLVVVLGVVALLVATLGTVGIFLRMRTATLGEIQLRLAALEEMLAPPADRR